MICSHSTVLFPFYCDFEEKLGENTLKIFFLKVEKRHEKRTKSNGKETTLFYNTN
jgi:hypothetical protein